MIDDRYDDSRADVARRGSSARGADRRDGADVIANIVQAVLAVVVFVLVLHIVFVLGAANHHNAFVHGVHQVAKTLVLGLDDVFGAPGAKARVALNFGLAAVLYLVAGGFVIRLLRRS